MREIKLRSFNDSSEGVIIFSNGENHATTMIIPEEMWYTFVAAIVEVNPGTGKTVTIGYEEDADEEE